MLLFISFAVGAVIGFGVGRIKNKDRFEKEVADKVLEIVTGTKKLVAEVKAKV